MMPERDIDYGNIARCLCIVHWVKVLSGTLVLERGITCEEE